MTGVPSFERRYAVEHVLRKKNIAYSLLTSSAQSTLRSVLFDISKSLAVCFSKFIEPRNALIVPQ